MTTRSPSDVLQAAVNMPRLGHPSSVQGLLTSFDQEFERDNHAHDRLLGRLHPPGDSGAGRAEVERVDVNAASIQVASAGKKSGVLGPADALAAGKERQVGPFVE